VNKFCFNCGFENMPNAKYCLRCGTCQLEQVIPISPVRQTRKKYPKHYLFLFVVSIIGVCFFSLAVAIVIVILGVGGFPFHFEYVHYWTSFQMFDTILRLVLYFLPFFAFVVWVAKTILLIKTNKSSIPIEKRFACSKMVFLLTIILFGYFVLLTVHAIYNLVVWTIFDSFAEASQFLFQIVVAAVPMLFLYAIVMIKAKKYKIALKEQAFVKKEIIEEID